MAARLAARSHRCPECGRSWRQRDARFCGSCGSLLAPFEEERPRRWRSDALGRVAGVALVTVIAVALVGAVTSLDLAPDGPGPADPVVRIEARPETQPNPLSSDEARVLRSHADTDRMRCEPRGCEGWRLEIGQLVWHDPYAGVVVLDDGLVVLYDGPFSEVRSRSDGSAGLSRTRGHRVVAVDPTTGERVWSRDIFDDGGQVRTTDVRLQPGPHGAMLLAQAIVSSLTETGEVVWEYRGRWGMLEDGLVVVIDEAYHLHRLDPTTGEVLWQAGDERYTEALAVGDWLLATTLGGDQHVIDAGAGELLGIVSGRFLGEPAPAPGGLVGIMSGDVAATGGPAVTPAPLWLASVAPDGSTTWTTSIGDSPAWWDCCVVDARGATVGLQLADEKRTYDLATGALSAVESTPGLSPPDGLPRPPISDDVELRWTDDRQQVTIRTPDGELTVRGQGRLNLVSLDPLIVTDGRDLLHVRPVAVG